MNRSPVLENFPDAVDQETLQDIKSNMDAIGISAICDDMESAIISENDWILKNVDCATIVLSLEQKVDELLRGHAPGI